MQLSVFSCVGSLSDLLQTVDSYIRMHAKAQVKTAKTLFKNSEYSQAKRPVRPCERRIMLASQCTWFAKAAKQKQSVQFESEMRENDVVKKTASQRTDGGVTATNPFLTTIMKTLSTSH